MNYETRFNDKNYDDIFPFLIWQRTYVTQKTGLYYHAYDSSKCSGCDKVTGLSHFWLRAMKVCSMALLDTLDKADASVGEPYEKWLNLCGSDGFHVKISG